MSNNPDDIHTPSNIRKMKGRKERTKDKERRKQVIDKKDTKMNKTKERMKE